MKKRIRALFLGTAGGRVVTFRLIRRSGGVLLELGDLRVQIDPGPGAFVYLKEKGIDYRRIDLLVLSHIHLDHSADANTLIEACTDGGRYRRLALAVPRSAVEGEDRVILPYLIRRLSDLLILREGEEFTFRGVKIRAVMRHTHHGVETYGLSFDDTVVYIPCSKYESGMLSAYPRFPRLLVVNTTFYRKRPHIEHLSVEEVRELIDTLRPETTVITHFSLELLQKDPDRVARELSEELGLEVIAARDGMELIF